MCPHPRRRRPPEPHCAGGSSPDTCTPPPPFVSDTLNTPPPSSPSGPSTPSLSPLLTWQSGPRLAAVRAALGASVLRPAFRTPRNPCLAVGAGTVCGTQGGTSKKRAGTRLLLSERWCRWGNVRSKRSNPPPPTKRCRQCGGGRLGRRCSRHSRRPAPGWPFSGCPGRPRVTRAGRLSAPLAHLPFWGHRPRELPQRAGPAS